MKIRRIIPVLLCIAMLVTAVSAASYANESDLGLLGYNIKELKSMEQYDKTFIKNQDKSSEIYDKINRSFGNPEQLKEDDFPDYYGGSYANDNGELVVYLTDDSDSNSRDIKRRAGTDKIITKPCKYSYKMLTKIMNTINKYNIANPTSTISKNTKNYALLDGENKVVVYLDEYNQAQVEAFKKHVLDTPAIEFRKAIGEFREEVNVNAGSTITSGTKTASMGYRVKRNNENGIVTAAHFAALNAYVAKSGTNFAKCTARQCSGSVDASFCKITNSNYVPTNTLQGTSNTLSITTSAPGVGTIINKIGSSTGHTSGKILSTNASAKNEDDVLFTNLTSADYTSAAGDSGGVVYSYVSSTNTRYTLGIHMGASGSTRYYIKASLINQALGTSRY